MKIWLDANLLSQQATDDGKEYLSDDCGDCGDCDCTLASDTAIISIPAFLEKCQHLPYTGALVLSTTLEIQECADSRWLVCDPLGSGLMAVVDADAYALLQRFQTPTMMQEVIGDSELDSLEPTRGIALFVGLGFLRDPDRPAPPAQPRPARTLSAWLHVTNACNLNCHYCYVHKTSEHMADDTSRRAVDAVIRSALRHGYQHIKLRYAGGEATLRLPQVLATHDYALQQAQRHGLSLSATILSNGVALPQRFIDQLKLRHIGVSLSLDGVGSSHDRQRPFVNGKPSFAFVDRTISQLLAKHVVPGINVTVTQHNVGELVPMMEYILQRDLPFRLSYYRDNECSTHVAGLQFTNTQMINGMRAVFAYIEEHLPRRQLLNALIDKASTFTLHQHVCSMGNDYLVIDQRGGVTKCHAVMQQTVTTIEADDPLQALQDDRRGVQAVAVDQKEGCRTCSWRYWCSGGCPVLTYRLTGRNDIKSPNCSIYKALFPEALRLEALRLLKYETPLSFLST